MELILFHNNSSSSSSKFLLTLLSLNLLHFLLWLLFPLQDFDNIKTFVEEELQTSMVSFTLTRDSDWMDMVVV